VVICLELGADLHMAQLMPLPLTDMQINISKTKEIILGRISQDNLELLSTPAGTVGRVTTFKLLGIHLDDTLTWSTHVNAITSKATKRLYFLNLSGTGSPRVVPEKGPLNGCVCVCVLPATGCSSLLM